MFNQQYIVGILVAEHQRDIRRVAEQAGMRQIARRLRRRQARGQRAP